VVIQRFQYIVYGPTAPADLTIKFGKKISYGREKLILFGLGDGNTSNAFFGIKQRHSGNELCRNLSIFRTRQLLDGKFSSFFSACHAMRLVL